MAKVSEFINGAVAKWGGLAVLAVLAACLLAGFYCAGAVIARCGFLRLLVGAMAFVGVLVAIVLVGMAMANEIKAIRNGLK